MNRGRPRHEDILTPREWQVLELIEAGLTNEEIAGRLDISFGTVKYHVAEIISKLGVSSREQAPAAAREARTPAPGLASFSWLRGRLVLPAAGLAAAVALLLLSALVFTSLFQDDGNSSPSDSELAQAAVDFEDGNLVPGDEALFASSAPLTSYYMEAQIEAEEDDVLNVVRAWYQTPQSWRFEFGDFADGIPAVGALQVSDGETLSFFEASTNTYTRQPIETFFRDMPPEMRGAPLFLPTSLMIGPLPAADPDAFLEALTANWSLEERAEGPVIVGRPSLMLRYSVPGAGEFRLWLDREYPFVLRLETESAGSPQGNLLVKITDLALNQPIDAARFAFNPPQDAVEVAAPENSSGHSSGSSVGGAFDPPEGFFEPAYVPNGYTVTGTEMSSSSVNSQATAEYVVHLDGPDAGAFLEVAQRYRAGGLGSPPPASETVSINGTTAFHQEEGGVRLLTWEDGDIVITLRADQLSLEDLLRIAASMR